MKTSNFALQQKPQRNKKKLFLVLGVVLAIAVLASGTGLYVRHRNNQARQAEQKANDEAQTDSSKQAVQGLSDEEAKKIAKSSSLTTEQVPTNSELSLTITDYSQSDGMIRASAALNAGNPEICVFSFTHPEAKPVVKEVKGSGGNCSLSVSENEFDMIGSRNLKVVAYINDTKVEANRSVTIQ